jgi:hypothetical protein
VTRRANLVLVTAAAAITVLGLVGFGIFGRRVEHGFGGAFRANGTLLTPAGPAFWIWVPVYAGLAAFVGWLWIGDHASRPRIRAACVPAALVLALTGSWLVITQLNQAGPTGIWLSVAVIFALELSLVGTLRRLQFDAPEDRLEAVLVDGVFGLHLGWTTIAAIANITAALVAHGVVIAVVALLGVVFDLHLGPRLSVAAALAWGLAWIGVGRLTSDLRSPLVGFTALGSAAVVLLAAVWLRSHRRQPDAVAPVGNLFRE